MIIAVDFDGTVCEETNYPDFGDFLPGAVDTLKALAAQGHELALWTCRTGEQAQRVFQHCLDAGIPFKYVNEGMYEDELHQYKKLFADVYIDNRNFGGGKTPVDWNVIANNLLDQGDAQILWKGKFIQVISPRGAPYEAVSNGNSIIVFLVDPQKRLAYIRREHCPPYEYHTGLKHWYTIISGGIEKDETPIQAAIREVKEEVGIDLSKSVSRYWQIYHGKFMKTVVDNITVFLITVSNAQIEKPSGDGTLYEKESAAVAVPYDEILDLRPRDFLLEAVWSLVQPYIAKLN